ncbi:hypothetical protein G6F68_010976 [Rhizopus microsporus]|nr:hypothetical protein G6F68_010976 [Rhizopus microsporus]
MPISSTMPISAMIEKSRPHSHSISTAPIPAEGSVDRMQCGQDQHRLAGQRLLERLRGTLETAADAGRHADLRLCLLDQRDRLAQRDARRQVERQVHRRQHAIVADRQRTVARRLHLRHGRQRHHLPGQRRAQVEVGQRVDLAEQARCDLQDHPVLVGIGLELVDLALAEGVVEHLVDIVGGEAEARCGGAVDLQPGDTGAHLLVVGHVAQLRQAAQARGQLFGPARQFAAVLPAQGVLVLGARRTGTEVDVLRGAHVHGDAGHAGHLRAQAVDEGVHVHVAVAAVLEDEPEAPVGQGLAATGRAHRMVVGQQRRIFGGDLRQLLVLGRHVLEADKPLGIITYDATATATVAPKPSSISRGWPSAHCRLRS